MKRSGNKYLKLVAATSMAIFSLFTVFMGTFAWFVAQRTQNASNDDFGVSRGAGKISQITFHPLETKIIGNTYSTSTFNFSRDYVGKISYNYETQTVVKSGNTDIELYSYDYLEHEQPLLLLVEFKEEYAASDPIKISATVDDGSAFYLGKRDSNGVHEYNLADSDTIVTTQNAINYYGLSSAVCFYTEDYSAGEYTSTFGARYSEEPDATLKNNVASALSVSPVWDSNQELWTTTINVNQPASTAGQSYFNNAANISGFSASMDYQDITREGGTTTYEGIATSSTGFVKVVSTSTGDSTASVQIIVGLGDPYFELTGLSSKSSFVSFTNNDDSVFTQNLDGFYNSSSSTKYVAIVIDYYSDAVEYIYSSFLGDTTLESYDNILHFICDWTMEIF